MIIPPKYLLTPKISELLSSIQGSRDVIESHTILPEIEVNLRRESTLRSSLFSARIEGNQLTLDELPRASARDQKKIEVMNILKAKNWIRGNGTKKITKSNILILHKIAMKGLVDSDNLGRFRNNMEAIFNSAGMVVYMPPSPRLIDFLTSKLIKYVEGSDERFIPIKAVLAHYSFEKIHPFLDGSGRVGRLLIQQILTKGGFGMKGVLPLEEYLENQREEYYRMLEEPEENTTEYVEFMLKALSDAAERSKELVMQKKEVGIEDTLLPRRAEIFRIVRDHKLVNFDQIRRRFPKINERTLRHDLKKLQDQELIRKLGITRGAYYISRVKPEA